MTTESVNLDLEWNGMFPDMYLPLPGCVALPQNVLWKHGADEAAAVRSQCSHSVMVTSLKRSETTKKKKSVVTWFIIVVIYPNLIWAQHLEMNCQFMASIFGMPLVVRIHGYI